jgi:hypothetical protein
MNLINRLADSIFDVILAPFELLGQAFALILVSGLFGIAALLIFKQISWQAGIKATKDRIKGHLIAIRIYQDDLGIVGKSVGSIVLRNFQYIGLNFGPILPLVIPFVLVASQFVVRYGFDPIPITPQEQVDDLLMGEGTMIEIVMKDGHETEVEDLSLRLPKNFVAISPLVKNAGDGVAFQEVIAYAPDRGDIEIMIGDRMVGSKAIVAGGQPTRTMQPERVSGFFASWLWPAEDRFDSDSPIDEVRFEYPERDLGWLPGGPFGILVVFVISSMLFGLLVLKPLNIQI